MPNSRGIVAIVKYMKGDQEHTQEVEFAELPRYGDEMVFHGDGWDYHYLVIAVIHHMKPGPTIAGVRHPDVSWPEVWIGNCKSRVEL